MATIHGATLNGSVNPGGLDTTVQFVYGTDAALLDSATLTLDVTPVPAGNAVVPVSAPVTDLLAETAYFFKVTATNSLGLAEGTILSFTTLADEVVTALPIVETLPATDIV
jgi:hypothetical protein